MNKELKKNTDFLWELIQGLSGSEKRYFKIFIQGKKSESELIYFKLYDFIEKQKKGYDEDAIKKQLKKNGNFSITKNYLFELVLQSLEAYYAENKIDILIKRLINYSDILRQKNITEASYKYLSKAETIAHKYERFAILVEIKHKQSLQILDSGNKEKIENYIQLFSHEEQKLLDLQREVIAIKKVTAQTHILYKKFGGLAAREQKEEIEKLKNEISLKNISALNSFHSKSYAYTVLGVLNSLQKNTKESFENRFALYELYKNHTHFIEDKIQAYAGNLYNLCTSSLALGKYDLAEKFIPELEKLPAEYEHSFSETNSILTVMRALNLHLLLAVYKNEFGNILQHIQKVESINDNYNYSILNDYIITSYLIAAMMLTINNDYKDALIYVNRILNFRQKEFRNDVLLYARFVNIVVHYQLNNIDLIDYELKNLQYFIGKNFLFPDVENKAVAFFNQLLKEPAGLKKSKNEYFPLSVTSENNNKVFDNMLERIMLSVIK